MFDNLVESTSHKDDSARKGKFLLVTVVIYSMLLLAAMVASIIAYDAHLENQNLELTTLVAPVPVQKEPDPPKQEEAPKIKVSQDREVPTVTEINTMRPEASQRITDQSRAALFKAFTVSTSLAGLGNTVN